MRSDRDTKLWFRILEEMEATIMTRKHKPNQVTMPMYIANIMRIKLNKNGSEKVIVNTPQPHEEYIWWGHGLPLYRFDLRFESGTRYDTQYIRAKSPTDAIKRIKAQYPHVIGVQKI